MQPTERLSMTRSNPDGDPQSERNVDVELIEPLHGLAIRRGADQPVHDAPRRDLYPRRPVFATNE
jgi:hypothetical protein